MTITITVTITITITIKQLAFLHIKGRDSSQLHSKALIFSSLYF